jgi:hypothetical protein
MEAFNWLALTYVVNTDEPFHRTVELAASNPEPLTVKVKAGPPACAVEGEMLLMAATGIVLSGVIVKIKLLATTPPLFTDTVAAPGDLMRMALIFAVSWVALTNVVETDEPFHRTVEFDAKPEPLTVRVKEGPPSLAVDGLRLLTAGPGGVMVNDAALLDVPFVVTVTVTRPGAVMRLPAIAAVSRLGLTKVVGTEAPLH